jgi:hypothetical protein
VHKTHTTRTLLCTACSPSSRKAMIPVPERLWAVRNVALKLVRFGSDPSQVGAGRGICACECGSILGSLVLCMAPMQMHYSGSTASHQNKWATPRYKPVRRCGVLLVCSPEVA